MNGLRVCAAGEEEIACPQRLIGTSERSLNFAISF